MKKIVLLNIVLFFSLITQEAISQTIKGRIDDVKTSKPIEGANVWIKCTTIGTVTNKNGEFLISNLENGSYKIRVSFAGYKTTEIKIKVENNTVVHNIELKEENFGLETIVVTGTHTERTLKNTPILTQVISEKQIEQSGINSPLKLLETAKAGIDFFSDGRGTTMRMQGLSPKYTLILIDGERIAGETRDNIDYTRLNSENIEQIEIINGSAASLYGSSAIGGVINIITKKPKKPLEISTHSYYSKYNELSLATNVGFRKDKFSSFTSLNRKSSDGYDITPESSDVYTVEPFEIHSINQKLNFNITKKLELNIKGGFFQYERFDVSSMPSHRKNYDWNYGFSSKYFINKKHHIKASYYSDHYETVKVLERIDKEKREYSNQQDNAKIVGTFNLNENKIWKANTITAGVEFLNDFLISNRVPEDKSMNNFMFFGQDEIKFSDKLTSILGYRMDFNSEFGVHVSPQISLMYKLSKFKFRTTFGTGFRAPSLKERYYDFDLTIFRMKGNPDLTPETSKYGSFSVEYQHRKFNTYINLHYNRLDNMITEFWQKGASENIATYRNIDEARVLGFDFNSNIKINKNLKFSCGYSYVEPYNLKTEEEIWGSNKHSANCAVMVSMHKENYSLNCELRGKIFSKKLYEDFDKITNLFTYKTYPAHSMWNLSINQNFNSAINLTFGINNLLDLQPRDELININPGRQYFVSLKMKLEKLYDMIF